MRRMSDLWMVWLGIGLIIIGITVPDWFGPNQIGLTETLQAMEREESGSLLMIAAFMLVALNTIISFPYYLGAFLLGEKIGEIWDRPWLKTATPLVVVPLVHIIINSTMELSYHFGGTAIFLLLTIYVLQKLGKGRLGFTMKSLVLTQLLFGVKWLNLVPFLSAYGFGHGSVSIQVKEMAVQLGFDQVLTLYSVVLCLIFMINAIVLGVYLGVYAEKWTISQELHRAQLEAMESRSGREVLHLVHDLKTPLTTIEGLISLIEMRSVDHKMKEYCRTISLSIRSMSDMISEILYENRKHWCYVKDLIDYVRASRLSGTKASLEIELPEDQNVRIWINKIRITRAIVNLIDNAFDAIQGRTDGKVTLRAQIHESEIWIGVSDNGFGLSSEERKKVWQAGYSTKQHPGVGLSFVRQVAEGHGGAVSIDSEMGRGTTVWIQLPKEDAADEDFDH
ncbi:HAMP domain-containing histidine kinase [Brevibacillus humidisoli]|uniref:sensor histidine kinase n=1 Tax=Brevibacillus humidisoli TaxID=2895522 RepID=UPI001E314156|nr:HAMP domain-containing sensor histidine kinase [Brevibacillus humidisoli]UFJ38872.1 HAMP domain-containing histidine kinase [Brevibacillus humidisoli]